MNNEDVSERPKCLFMNVSTDVVAFAVLLCFSILHANVWTTKQSMVNTRRFPVVAAVSDKLYAIGGDGTATTEEFDPVNNSWATLASMPTVRWWGFGAGTVNGKIYAIGGATGGLYLDENEEFDPSSNTWTSKTPMPTERHGLAIGVIHDTIYAIGGRNSTGYLSVNEAYDPATNTWTSKAPIPTARYYLAIAVANGKIYAIGGYGASGNLATVEEYDPATDTWTSRTDMPTARHEHAAATLNGRIYAIGGWNGASDLAINEEYDPIGDSWTTRASMPTARSGLAIAAIADSIYAVGGLLGFTYLATNEMYYFDPVGITLPCFYATAQYCCVQVHWSVAMENNYYYSIVRKPVNQDTYHEIACIPCKGPSPSPQSYTYTDSQVLPGEIYCYKLGIVDMNNHTKWYGPVSVSIPLAPEYMRIIQNPVRETAVITYAISRNCMVTLSVYDITGKLVRNLFGGNASVGTFSLWWDTRDHYGKKVSTGHYICKLSTPYATKTIKIIVMR